MLIHLFGTPWTDITTIPVRHTSTKLAWGLRSLHLLLINWQSQAIGEERKGAICSYQSTRWYFIWKWVSLVFRRNCQTFSDNLLPLALTNTAELYKTEQVAVTTISPFRWKQLLGLSSTHLISDIVAWTINNPSTMNQDTHIKQTYTNISYG